MYRIFKPICFAVVLCLCCQVKLMAQCPEVVACTPNPNTGESNLTLIYVNTAPPSNLDIIYNGINYSPSHIYAGGTTILYDLSFCQTGNEVLDITFTISDGDNMVCTYEGGGLITGPFPCPSSVSCGAFGFNVYFDTGDPLPPGIMDDVAFFFNDNPSLNGVYAWSGTGVSGGITYFYYDDIACVQGADDDLTMVLGQGTGNESVCVFQNGAYCPGCEPFQNVCEPLLAECGPDLIDYISTELGPEGEDCQQWNGKCDEEGIIWREKRVAIGTDSYYPDFQLTVKGGIMTESFRVCDETNPVFWCDYVFEKDYELMALEEVECFIEEHGHLHKTKSAGAINKEGGFELRSVTLDHQEKIEEIFLHLIELKKQADQMQAELDHR